MRGERYVSAPIHGPVTKDEMGRDMYCICVEFTRAMECKRCPICVDSRPCLGKDSARSVHRLTDAQMLETCTDGRMAVD